MKIIITGNKGQLGADCAIVLSKIHEVLGVDIDEVDITKFQDVEDLVQTAMMTALENLSSYRGPDKFKFWLDRLTINVVRSYFRKSKLRKIFFSEIDPEQAISPNHHGDARRLETQQLFRKLTVHLSRIGAKNRMALVLSMVHGYQAKEIAEIVNCSTEAAWKRTKRGYDELMTRIARDTELDRNLKELFHA